MTTKQKILAAALELFNKQGLYKVSLRGIANEINISQGNLSYHYKKKEDIIESLYHDLVHHIDDLMMNANQTEISIKTMYYISQSMFYLFYDYRFFLLDFNQIMKEQPSIKKHYNELVKIRKAQSLELFKVLTDENLIRPEKFKGEFENLYIRIQILSDFWMSSVSIENNNITKTTTDKYIKIVTESIYPYLTEKGILEYKNLV